MASILKSNHIKMVDDPTHRGGRPSRDQHAPTKNLPVGATSRRDGLHLEIEPY